MNPVSVLGLIALLGLAWALSFDRRDIRFRSIIWGIGLQFLFALIILREDVWSFVGMGILSLLIVAFLMRPEQGGGIQWQGMAGVVAGGAAISAAFYQMPTVLTWICLAILAFLVLNSRFRLVPALQRYAGALFVLTLIGVHARTTSRGVTCSSSSS